MQENTRERPDGHEASTKNLNETLRELRNQISRAQLTAAASAGLLLFYL